MLGHRELTMEDYGGILKRRLWLILICAIVFLGVGIGVTSWIPTPVRVANTRCSSSSSRFPTDYVTPVVTPRHSAKLVGFDEGADPEPLTH